MTVNFSRSMRDALQATQGNISVFLEEQAVKDDRVAAYLAQRGTCKVEGCAEPIDVRITVYCSIPGNDGLCPGWFCPEHYEEIHLGDETKETQKQRK